MANTFNKNRHGDIILEYRLSYTQSHNLTLILCDKTGYHVHRMTTQYYKCFNTVDVGYSKSLQFKDLTRSKQDTCGASKKSMATVQSASAHPTAIQAHRHLAEVNSRRHDRTGANNCHLICDVLHCNDRRCRH